MIAILLLVVLGSSGRAKLLMTVEAIVSFGIFGLVIARAINILK